MDQFEDPYDSVIADMKRTLGTEDRAVIEKSPYDDVIVDMATEQQRALDASLRQAVTVKPEEAARQHSVAETADLPVGVVERNIDHAEQMAKVRELQDLARTSPILARQLSDPEFAKRAHGDMPTLRGMSTLFSAKRADEKIAEHTRKIGQAGVAGYQRTEQGLAGLAASIGDIVSKYASGPLARVTGMSDPYAKTGEFFRGEAKERERLATEARPKTEGWWEQNIYAGVENILPSATALTLGALTRSPNLALSLMVAPVVGEQAAEAEEKGFGPLGALTYGISQGVVEWYFERNPAVKLLKDLEVGTPFFKMVAHNMVREGYGEQMTTLLQDLNQWATLRPEAPFSDYLKERPSAAASTLVQTIVAVGGQTAIVKGLVTAGQAITGDAQLAQQAAQDNAVFTQLTKMAQASSLAEHSPQTFAEYTQAEADNGSFSEVLISGEQVRAAMSQMPNVEWPVSVREQLPEALDFGTDVRIPVGEYASTLALSDASEALLPHLRRPLPDGRTSMSITEAKTFMEQEAKLFKQQAEQILSTEEVGSQIQVEAEQVEQYFTEQLATANRWAPGHNAGYAALLRDFYTAMAPRGNMTPMQMLQAYPLNFTAEPVVDMTGMDQPAVEEQPVVQPEPSQLDIGEGIEKTRGVIEEALGNEIDEHTIRRSDKGGGFDIEPALSEEKRNELTARGIQVDQAGTHIDDVAPPAAVPHVLEQGPALKARELALSAGVERHLKPHQRDALRASTAKSMIDFLSKLPSKEEQGAVALAGKAKRGWYAQSAEAIVNVFGPDAPRFAALLAALSPQTKVEPNLRYALSTWKEWIKAGRPQQAEKIMKAMKRGGTPMLPAYLNNAVRALTAQDPGRIALGGPKVSSFFLNLVGVVDEVTNDGWMAAYAAVDVELLSGHGKIGYEPPAYLAMTVRARETAEYLTELTGETWTPSEVQETVWSWSKTAFENANAQTSVLDLVLDGKITDDLITATPDFRSLFSTPGNRKLLEGAGYAEQLETLRRSDATARAQEPSAGGQAAPPSEYLVAAAVRLDKFRFARIEGRTAARNVLDQGPSVGEVANPDINEGPMVNIGLATNDGKGISIEQALEALEAKGVTPVRYEVHKSDTEQTLVAQTSRALTPAEADAVSKELGQEAIAQVDEKGKGELYGPGADAWKPFNPEFFVALGGARMAQTPPDDPYHPARGHIYFGENITQGATITLLKNADLSTTFHEMGHFFLEVMTHMAAQPNAPAGISADVAAVLKWFGAGSLQEWRAMHIDEKRPHHEKFARGFEAYIFEGNAPSLELQGLFSKFRVWMLRVYQTIKDLNVRLTPEVRTVFDKMLASEAQIQSMKQTRAMMPLFSTPEEANANAEEWAAYQALGAQATEDAVNELQSRTLGDLKWVRTAQRGHLKRLQDEASEKRTAIREEVTKEVDEYPVYRVTEHLRTAAKEEKLALPALKDMYGTEPDAVWRRFHTGKTSMVTADETGRHPDQVAAQFEFTSGDEMVRAILDAENKADRIDGMTDQRMLERYAELTDERTVQRAADKAINNEARAKFVATELRFLSRVANAPSERTPRGGTINLLARAAKQEAERVIAKKKINALRPALYRSAEVTNAKAALNAVDPMQKALHKRNQLLNMHAARAAERAVEELEKGIDYVERVRNSKTIDQEYLDQIHTMLERFSFKTASAEEVARRKTLANWIDQQRSKHNFEPQIPEALLNEVRQQHYSTLTMEEFRGLVDSIKNIEHLGRLKHKLLTAKDQREFEAIISELVQSIRDNANRTHKQPLEEEPRLFAGIMADHRTLSSLLREMDGGKMGGKFWNLLVRPMNTAGNTEVEMGAEATVKLGKLLKPVLKEGRLSKKIPIPAIKNSLSKEARLTIALNMGNASNLQRLMGGEGWSQEQVQAILDTLTKTEMDFVQGVWNLFAHYRPLIAAKEKRVNGTEPEWIEATPVVTRHGTYPGGYYPVKYNTRRSTKAQTHADAEEARRQLYEAYTTATTRRSFIKARADEVHDRPLTYRMSGLFQGINEVIHDLAWHEWLIDANRLMNNGAVGNIILKHYGPEIRNTLKKAVSNIARGDNYAQSAAERWVARLRHGVSIVGLGWNPFTAALQPVGLTQSMSLIGPQWVLKGMNQWMTSPEVTMEMIKEKWPFMRHRATTMQRDIREIQGRISGKSTTKEFMDASHFIMLQKMQVIADVPTLLGAYERAKSEGKDEDTARAYAETAVLDSQGGGQIKDLSAIQQGSEFQKTLTTFYSFFNKTHNVSAEKTRTAMTVSQKLHLPGHYMLLFIIPAVLSALIKGIPKGEFDDDEPEEIAAKLAKETIGYALGTVVGLRELGGGLQGYQYSGAAGMRVFAESNKLVQQVMQGEADEGLLRSLNQFLGIVFKYPAGQVDRTARGIMALEDDETENPAVILLGPEKKQ